MKEMVEVLNLRKKKGDRSNSTRKCELELKKMINEVATGGRTCYPQTIFLGVLKLKK